MKCRNRIFVFSYFENEHFSKKYHSFDHEERIKRDKKRSC